MPPQTSYASQGSGGFGYGTSSMGVTEADRRKAVKHSRKVRRTKGSKSMYSLDGLSPEALHRGKPKRYSPGCVFSWIIVYLIYQFILLLVLIAFACKSFRHSFSSTWVYGPESATAIPRDSSLVIHYNNLFGRLRVREDNRGTEFLMIRRVDMANRGPDRLKAMTRPVRETTESDGSKVTHVYIKGPSFVDFILNACRRAEFTVYLPIGSHVDELDVRATNGEILIDAGSVTFSSIKIWSLTDLENFMSGIHILNGRIGTLTSYTLKPHVCLGDESGNCAANIDAHVRKGVTIAGMSIKSTFGNILVSNTTYSTNSVAPYENWTPLAEQKQSDAHTSWKATTFNGFIHLQAMKDSDDGAFPSDIDLGVTTTTYRFKQTPTVQAIVPQPLLNGYKVSSKASFEPASQLSGGCVVQCEDGKTLSGHALFGDVKFYHQEDNDIN